MAADPPPSVDPFLPATHTLLAPYLHPTRTMSRDSRGWLFTYNRGPRGMATYPPPLDPSLHPTRTLLAPYLHPARTMSRESSRVAH